MVSWTRHRVRVIRAYRLLLRKLFSASTRDLRDAGIGDVQVPPHKQSTLIPFLLSSREALPQPSMLTCLPHSLVSCDLPILSLVPSSAGIGRTGCFIATRIGCQQLKARGEVDILGIVCQLRLDRWVHGKQVRVATVIDKDIGGSEVHITCRSSWKKARNLFYSKELSSLPVTKPT